MDKKKLLRQIGIGLGAVLFFLVLAYGFVPQVLEGKIVNQSDISGYIGMSHEMDAWNKAHPDDPTYWTGSMFSGMPTTAISTRNAGDWTQALYDLLLTGKRPATYLFIALLGAFLLMLAFGISWPLAIGGAVAIAFCSYNFQIIQVGHNTKMQAIAFMPWVLAALVWTYRTALGERGVYGSAGVPSGAGRKDGQNPAQPGEVRRWLPQTVLGAVLFALALSMQIKANHQQITYYLALVVLLYALVLLIDVLWKRRAVFGRFAVASALLLVLGCVGIATNVNKLLPLYKYQEHTMRGGSELSGEKNNAKGLDIDYATAWSYGWEELPNLMIPNFNGGASSAPVDPDKSATAALLRRAGQGNIRETVKHLPMYWGPQPFTAGPMYMGAISVFLFLLGLLLYRGKEKWWLLAATLLAVFMAVGSHFMAFTKLCFAVLPLYSKFRTVSMALVILQVTLPLLGFLALDRILKQEYDARTVRRKGLLAYALTAGFCLVLWLVPSLAGDFSAASDAGQPDILAAAFAADRMMLLRQDALLSFLLITAAFLLLIWALLPKGGVGAAGAKNNAGVAGAKGGAGTISPGIPGGEISLQRSAGRRSLAGAAISILLLINMFSVGKRYLNAGDFTTPKDFSRPFAERPVDKMIHADEAPSYRVLDLTVNVFNSSVPSYHHKSVGGYSPAKLQRYQDLIDRYLNPEINTIYGAIGGAATTAEAQAALPSVPVLNALNTRYIIVGAENAPLYNSAAFGPAWLVDGIAPAGSPDEEIALLGTQNLRHTAVIGPDFLNRLSSPSPDFLNRLSSLTPDNEGLSSPAAQNGQQGAGNNPTEFGAGTGQAGTEAQDGSSDDARQQRIASSADGPEEGLAEEDVIELTSYAPNTLRYHYHASTERLAVFSEVYYPGWNGYLDSPDGTPVEILRADWTLRAALLPPGEHDLILRFEPTSYRTGARISRASSILLILLTIAALAATALPPRHRTRTGARD